MPTCNECGAFVTSQFGRVFGDNQDEVFGCRNCMPVRALVDGAASREDS